MGIPCSDKGGAHVSLSAATVTNKKLTVQIKLIENFRVSYLDYCAWLTEK